jgi:hypothetical protein
MRLARSFCSTKLSPRYGSCVPRHLAVAAFVDRNANMNNSGRDKIMYPLTGLRTTCVSFGPKKIIILEVSSGHGRKLIFPLKMAETFRNMFPVRKNVYKKAKEMLTR